MLDLLRVIRHHQARLATPIRTVQQRVSDTDLGYIPYAYADPTYHGAATSKRPMLLSESPYKINGEDQTKPTSVQANGEDDTKTTPDNRTGVASGVSRSQFPNVDVVENHKGTNKTSSGAEQRSKAIPKGTSETTSKTDHKKSSSVSSSDSGDPQDISVNKLLKKLSRESVLSANSSAILPAESRREALTPQPSSKPALEDNIVLDVALRGSKQTLPIKEGIPPSPYQAEEANEFAISHSSNGSVVAKPDKQENQYPDSPSTTSVE